MSDETEVQIIELRTDISPLGITANLAEVEAFVREQAEMYSGLTVEDESSYKLAKSFRAGLRRMSKEFNDRRKGMKKEALKPWDDFEAELKRIDRYLLDEADRLDVQLKEIDEQNRQERYSTLKEIYDTDYPLLASVVPFDQCLDDAWLLRSTNSQKAFALMTEKVNAIAKDWETFKTLELEYAAEAEALFFRSLSLQEAISGHAQIVEERKRIAELSASVAAQEASLLPEPSVEPQAPPAPAVDELAEPIERFVLTLECSKSQLEALVGYCKENGIKGRIKSE